jgi:hypothetical protein
LDRKLDISSTDFEKVIVSGTGNPKEFLIRYLWRVDQPPAMGSRNERVFLAVNH